MINIKNISFSYPDKKVIENFSLDIKENDRICLFGESGCGKTTLLRLILGLEKAEQGKIATNGELRPSVVFQENRLLPFKTCLENLTLLNSNTENALFHLKELGIESVANLKPNELSGGMKRRLAIARALNADFDFLVLDEPFTGLDETNLEITANHILKTAGNRPIILVTHSLKEAELLNARIVNM
ncbi:MAG: ABC transporter ATP-binding protein [Ruminococcaceae bacterium]|nr:ABC transporter ATP-binding protein [Oscillospiraceae bacterium]